MTRVRSAIALGIVGLIVLIGGCASAPGGVQVDQSDDWIRTEWALNAPQPGGRRISGYIYNTRNYYAGQVRLLVEAFDAGNQRIEGRYQWVPGGVPPNNRAYFEVRDVPVAERYRVSVPYYAWYDGPNRGFFGIRF